jgi:hypothetical protein
MEMAATVGTVLLILIFVLLANRELRRKKVFIDPEDIKNPAGENEFVSYLIDHMVPANSEGRTSEEWFDYFSSIFAETSQKFIMHTGRSLLLINRDRSLRNAAQAVVLLEGRKEFV